MNYPGHAADQVWRTLVFPADYRNPAPADRYNLVVIGAGPAGLVISIAAAGLGAKVALIERYRMGGDCLNVGCVPSKTLLASATNGLSFDRAMARVRAVRAEIAQHDSVARYTQAGVDVFLGAAEFIDPHRVRVDKLVLTGKKIVIATGASAFVPPIPGLAAQALTNENIFDLQEQPRRLAILGGGPIGCELAQAFARLGTAVHLIEMQPRILPIEDESASQAVQLALAADGVHLHLGRKVTSIETTHGAKQLRHESTNSDAGSEAVETLEVDVVLAAIGRQRNVARLGLEAAGVRFDPRGGIEVDARLRTSQRHIFAAGDVCSRYQFTHMADAHARIVVRNALFLGRARADDLVVPWCTYTKPEVAHVGATRRDLEQSATAFMPLRFEFDALDRGKTDAKVDAQSVAASDGYAELLVQPQSGRILGATIVGQDAGEQIAQLVLAMYQRTGLGSLGSLVLPYPTRSEYLRRLADAWNRTRLTPRTAGLLKWWLRRTR
ncbi:MAG: mercuric reductase [Pseudomonadales bacterium]|nr:mercuric reductase [Pseudomonadales bacterium]